jgi:hypothetical protein
MHVQSLVGQEVQLTPRHIAGLFVWEFIYAIADAESIKVSVLLKLM